MSQLVIRLPFSDDAPPGVFAYALSLKGQEVTRHGVAEAALLPFAGVQDVVALAPVQALSWHQAELPKGSMANPQKLRSVLDGLLEDRLLDDPADLHLALAPGSSAPGTAWVAVCQSAWLRGCLNQLEQAGCTVGRIVPEFHPAPHLSATEPALENAADAAAPADAHLYAVGDAADTACWVRTGSDLSSGAQAPGVLVWPLPQPEQGTLAQAATPPQQVGGARLAATQIQADPAVARSAEHWLHQPVAVLPAAQRWLQAAQSPWNLAQFAFANSGRDRLRKRGGQLWHHFLHAPHWRPVRWGLIGLLVVQLAGLNWWAWRTRTGLEQQKREIATILTTTFPEIKAVVDAPVQMQRQVALLQQRSGLLAPGDMEALLAGAAQHVPAAKLQALVWEAGQLRLKGLVLDATQQSAWQADLALRQLQLRQDGTDWLIGPAR